LKSEKRLKQKEREQRKVIDREKERERHRDIGRKI
jgi:hypothetical protein